MKKLRLMPVNVSSGRWAVAVVAMKGWQRDSAIGDGITSATMALLTRCATKEEAVALAARWNDIQPGVLPGSNDVFVYEAVPYRRNDYIGSQNLGRNQSRDCDRRIA